MQEALFHLISVIFDDPEVQQLFLKLYSKGKVFSPFIIYIFSLYIC